MRSVSADGKDRQDSPQPVGPFRRVVAGDSLHRTRLHDEKGNALPLSELRHVPYDAYLTLRRLATGRLPELPWIPFNAIQRIGNLLEPGWDMVEFGSGMSTAWYARRVARLQSIEHDAGWHKRISKTIPKNVRYDLRSEDGYATLADREDGSIDFAVIDGILRGDCMAEVIPKIKPGGWIYLDNSDKDMTVPNGQIRKAERLLRKAIEDRSGHLEQRTGLTVGALATSQWTLGRL
ncbi:MAG: class I SAM-dependent methyltransferase [Solirubrobacterales bacterium]